MGSDPFDCDSDPCHLAWIIRDERLFLTHISETVSCSNGTLFLDLDPSGLVDCPSDVVRFYSVSFNTFRLYLSLLTLTLCCCTDASELIRSSHQ